MVTRRSVFVRPIRDQDSDRPPNYKFINITLKMEATKGDRVLNSLGNRILSLEDKIEKEMEKKKKPSPYFAEVEENETRKLVEDLKNENTKRKTLADVKLFFLPRVVIYRLSHGWSCINPCINPRAQVSSRDRRSSDDTGEGVDTGFDTAPTM